MRLVGVYKRTTHDDDDAFYRQLVRETCAPETRAAGESLKTKNETGDPTRHARRRRLASEGDCVRALEALGFEAFYGGDANEEWVAQMRGKDV